jgi:HSP20 family molecular chaperone IbpA
LPPNADTANCEAKLEDGVLKVKLPKRQALTERTVEIK